MLNKQNRILVQSLPGKASKIIHLPFLIVRVYNNETDRPKFGVVVSKKIFKTAVLRNYYRRLTYSILRGLINSFKPGSYLIFIKQAVTKEELLKDLNKLKI